MDTCIEPSTSKHGLEIPSSSSMAEPLLGSLTTYNNMEGTEMKTQQIRSSARVIKKMKLDLAPPVVVLAPEKPREKKEDIKRCYKPLWNYEDKKIFFEALNEYGKDFESIHNFISSKMKKRGVPDSLIKTREQIRHLYYRTYNKVSKHVKFADGIKKPVQELYTLINYGELRRKMGSFREKTGMKLHDLIYTGSVMIKNKGKNVRIKTPMCRALRKINQLDENYDEVTLPQRVTVELRPKDMASFFKVQSLALNPRLRTTFNLQRRVGILIGFLSRRFRSVDAQMFEDALITSNLTGDLVPEKDKIEENRELLNPPLRLSPPAHCKIEIPSINLSEYFTRQSICLMSYEHRIGIRSSDDFELPKFCAQKYAKKSFRARTDSQTDKSNTKNTVTSDTDTSKPTELGEPVKKTVKPEFKAEPFSEPDNSDKDLEKERLNEQKLLQIAKIRNGWTEADCQTLTIGEIYLMFGSKSKIILEYSWDDCKPLKSELSTPIPDLPLITKEHLDEKPNKCLSDSLNKLISVAKLFYRNNSVKCPCGHVCGTPDQTQLKRLIETEIRRIFLSKNGELCRKLPKPPDEETFVAPSTSNQKPNPDQQLPPPNLPMVRLITQTIDRIQTATNRRDRKPKSKQVVQRQLNIMPDKDPSGHHIVHMNIVSKEEVFRRPVTSTPLREECTDSLFAPKFGAVLMDETTDNANEVLLNDSIPSVAISPSRLLKDAESWINAEVADYSFSSLLGRLDSSQKSDEISPDVDVHLQSLLAQTSVDFSVNFADLADQVVSEIKD